MYLTGRRRGPCLPGDSAFRLGMASIFRSAGAAGSNFIRREFDGVFHKEAPRTGSSHPDTRRKARSKDGSYKAFVGGMSVRVLRETMDRIL